MTAALFRIAIRATNDVNGLPILVIGYENGRYLAIDDGGKTNDLDRDMVTFDWRYNFRSHEWLDLGDDDDTQSDAPDGREGVSGELPDTDELSQGDPLDAEGGQAPGDPGDLDTGEANQ